MIIFNLLKYMEVSNCNYHSHIKVYIFEITAFAEMIFARNMEVTEP